MAPTEYLTVDELAERWRTTPNAVHQLRYRGDGPPGYRIGRRILFRLDPDVLAWEATRQDLPVA